MRGRILTGLLAAVAILLSACSGQSAQEEMYEHLEKAVELEEAFSDQQKPMVELEKKEQTLYEEIIDLNMDQFDKIKKKSQQAAEIVEKRKEKLKLEKESIESAKEEFDKIEPLVEDLDEENPGAKDKAEELIDTMNQRYKAYQDLYSAYVKALTLDNELYEMMQKKDLTEEQLQSQIEKINQSYNKVIEKNKEFNEHTETYNTLKKELYKALDFEVTYENNEDSSTKEE